MKKLVALLLAGCMMMGVASITACKGEDVNPTVATTTPTLPPEEPTPDPEIDTTDYFALMAEKFAEAMVPEEANFEYSTLENGSSVEITKYSGNAKAVILPQTLGGKTVTAIADGAFAAHTTLEVLVIGDNVEQIGTGVLQGCTSLKAISVPQLGLLRNGENAQYLGYLFGAAAYTDNAKNVPASLQYVKLTGNMTKVPSYAFAECNDLVCVKLSETVTAIEPFSFYNCAKLKAINLDRLTGTGAYALAGCRDLVRADFGASLTTIGLGTFQGCGALSAMTLPFVGGSLNENNYLGYIFGAEEPDFTAGYIPAYLRTLTLLDTCTVLGDYAFFECSVIRQIRLSQTLTSIGVRAFEKCTSLESIAFPTTLQTIRENAFFGCTSLQTVTFSEGLQSMGINVFYHCTALKEIKLPMSLKELPASAFAGCSALENVDFGGVERVGVNAFRGCTALKNVVYDNVVFTDGNEAVISLGEK